MRYSRDFDDLGENIRRTVQEACDTMDFSSLSRNISNTVNGAMNSIFGGKDREPDLKDIHPEPFAGKETPGGGYTSERKYIKTYGKKVLGMILSIGGFIVGGVFTAGALIVTAALPLIGASVTATAAGTLGVMAIPFLGAGIYGTGLLGKIRRYNGYLSVLGDRDYGNIRDFAERVRKPEQKVLKDVEYMLEKRWFLQGHLDSMNACLMTTDKAYREYMSIMRQKEEAKAAEKASAEEKAARYGSAAPEVRETLEKGEEFISKIKACNDAIPGEEVSEKIFRMEVLTRRIFERVKEEPDTVDDIRRLMDYYLPTAIKLLEAYEELDRQPVQGENIVTSKKEIEDTLDTLNGAFEKLLDNLFQDTAWDVSSDVSVLKTMLAQEGLTGKDFKSHNTEVDR